ncbi:MAG: peptidoglycan-associated lipoprotein [Cognaticolwellia sp.]|jgi:peptidoglycan-associated lipoprotein
MRISPRLACVLFALPLLMAAKCRNTETEIDPGDKGPSVNPAREQLQVVSIDPARVQANTPFTATVYGSSFVQGARVRFGEDVEATRVQVVDGNRLTVTVPPMTAGSWDVWVFNTDGASATLRSGLQVQAEGSDPLAACDGAMVYFEFDAHRLGPEAKQALNGLLPCLQQAPGKIWLDGHCDERGTTEYNLALGQRRAEQVRGHLISQGVSPERLQSRSYGEEQPLAFGSSEADWSKNRRVELVVER